MINYLLAVPLISFSLRKLMSVLFFIDNYFPIDYKNCTEFCGFFHLFKSCSVDRLSLLNQPLLSVVGTNLRSA
ncbi:hypothetical protein Avbf_11092 [Armadillidium vulgare]|nr:hypothetical protein Avbf_11092 [Armadillidium vulgare]